MSEKNVLLPDIGDFDQVEVVEIMVAEGDSVEKEESIISLESDKATMEIPSPFSGKVLSIKVSLGDKVGQGDLILSMEVEEEAAEPEAAAPATPAEPENVPAKSEPVRPVGAKTPAEPPVAAKATDFSKVTSHASPSVRRFARELGVDLTKVTGTGRKNRVSQDDVQNFVKQVMSGQGAVAPASGGGFTLPPVPVVDYASFGEIEEQTLSRIKKLSGPHLHGCWLNIPHVTQFDEADISELEDFRKQLKDEAARRGAKLTPMPFIMKAVVAALQQMPEFNSSLSADGEKLIVKKYFNLGIAVNTPNGLVVPVIKDVDQKSIYDLAIELMDVSTRARDGKLSPKDMQGGTFSISSLGGIGGTGFTPIVNAPEVAILGLSRSTMQPVWDGKEFQPKLMLPFSLSYDHRAIDGVQGVMFTSLLSQLLSDIRRILL